MLFDTDNQDEEEEKGSAFDLIDEEEDDDNEDKNMSREDRYYKYTHLKDTLREVLPSNVQLKYLDDKLQISIRTTK